MIPALACAFATHIGFSVLLNRLHALIVVRIVFWAATWRHYVIVSTSSVDGNTPSVFASAVLAGVSLQDSLSSFLICRAEGCAGEFVDLFSRDIIK